jgi:hypothetical protein
MIRFVDIGLQLDDEVGATPAFAFVDTVTNRFVELGAGQQVFESAREVFELGKPVTNRLPHERDLAMRCYRLIPKGWPAVARRCAPV